ncbi:LuxR C-terminal-related transcriptional regulator [Cellulomonas sp. ATA003]|uniref:LuxR C-terminal-related transcriptional regulator n=1 Tax=Cellulomonas sp. ATA003 TaxID=3073064 RepID=UPI002872E3E9|nr:LuxR C-terminal-related transcriptional regulator [Cellulomonas sp. ATA003]WNB84538.1 LuxR C-terminal-related transcriptional regulator [Cellulomonas sp. ATA003]
MPQPSRPRPTPALAPVPAPVLLTDRERVVLSRLERELTLGQIAVDLFVSRNTVKSQVRSVYRKLGVATRADALARARECGLR